MIYIIPLLLIVGLVIIYDLGGKRNGKIEWFYFLLCLFIAIGGFEYNVGSDMPVYMYEYDSYSWNAIHRISDLSEYRHRQPGWVFLNLFFKLFHADFGVFQFFNALFFNFTFFSFIKKNSKYLFLGLLFYAIVVFLNLNFNILRQSYSICFFLLGYEFLKKKKVLIYYMFACIAYLFHTSALICFIIPLFLIVKFNIKTLVISGGVLLALIFVALNSSFIELLFSSFSDLLSEEGALQTIGEAGTKFMGSHYERSDTITIFGIIESVIRVAFMVFITAYYSAHNKKCNSLWVGGLVVYVFCSIMDLAIPVMFYRFKYYFEIFYYISLSYCIVDICRRVFNRKAFGRRAFGIRVLCSALVCSLFMIAPLKTLFNINPDSGIPLIKQFYPYHSVFDKKIDPVRDYYFGSYR